MESGEREGEREKEKERNKEWRVEKDGRMGWMVGMEQTMVDEK